MRFISLAFSMVAGSVSCLALGSEQTNMTLIKLSDKKVFSRVNSDRSANRFAVDSIPELQTIAVKTDDPRLQNFIDLYKHNIVYQTPMLNIHLPRQRIQGVHENLSEGTNRTWGMVAIQAPEAWRVSKGEGIVVAVSDTGIYRSHGDLKENIWQNPGETGRDAQGRNKATNRIDDDANGHIDDTWGWAFNTNNNNPYDEHYHGTHVAGTIAAPMNGIGVVGAAPKAKLMSLKFIGGNGSGTDLGGAQTIVYAAKNGARIVNCSWGGSGDSPVITDAVAYAQARNVLVVTAAGNDGSNTDRFLHIPSGINLDNVISVGATANRAGAKARFSNYGILTVDLAAPGVDVMSTFNPLANTSKRSLYAKLSGTSMASPHVAGVAALIWSAQPQLTYLQVKQILMDKTVKVSPWRNKSLTEGVLNAKKSLEGF
jgi:subtilisin family serine protease